MACRPNATTAWGYWWSYGMCFRSGKMSSAWIGGWAVYALTEVFTRDAKGVPFRHRGSLDVDIALDLQSLTRARRAA